MRFECHARTHTGLVRLQNQDAVLMMPEHGLFVVGDGMGGEQAGEEASAQLIKTIQRVAADFFKRPPVFADDVERMLRQAIQAANHDVFGISVREPRKRGLGTTASVLCVHRGVYFIAQVGDSRVYLMRRGQVRQLTRDHTMVWALYEQGLITRDELETHPNRHLLTQCVGSQNPLRVDTFTGRIEPGDVFLVCSDGLTGYAGEQRVFAILTGSSGSIEQETGRLVQEALDAGGGDNVTALLVRIQSLDFSDNWQPSLTSPPPALDATITETVTEAQEPFPSTPDPTAQQAAAPSPAAVRSRRRRLGALAAGLAAALLVLLLVSGLRARPVKINLGELPPGAVAVRAVSGGGAVAGVRLRREGENNYLILPRPGEYQLTITPEGFAPLIRTVRVDGQAPNVGLRREHWIRTPDPGTRNVQNIQ